MKQHDPKSYELARKRNNHMNKEESPSGRSKRGEHKSKDRGRLYSDASQDESESFSSDEDDKT